MRDVAGGEERTVVQDVSERTCPGCGAQNKTAAGFCWRCFASLNPGAGPGTGPPPPPMHPFRMPGPTLETAETPKRTMPLAVWLAAGALLAAAIAWFAIGRLGGGPELPDSVAGYSRIEIPGLDEAIQAAKSQSNLPSGMDVDVGVYGGTQTSPRLMMMWATSDQLDDAEAAFVGVASGLGLTSETDAFQTFTRDGRSFLCASSADMGVTTPQAVDMCMWPDGGTIWVLMDFSPGPNLDATLGLAGQAATATA
jgi:hypothetical protein